MNFKRGIFCGLVAIIGSICSLFGWGAEPNGIKLLYIAALVLGLIQLMASFHYREPLVKRKILIGCFGVETVYYAVGIVYLLIYGIALEEKIFGTLVGVCMLVLVLTSIRKLYREII